MSNICPKCGDRFKSLGHHWRYRNSHRPDLSDEQMEILTGMVMGDATVHRPNGNAHIACEMINHKYLDYIDTKFPLLSQGVKKKHTAEQSANRARQSGFRPNANPDNYSDMYYWSCKAHPQLNEFKEWYTAGSKTWPKDIKLTPITLKHWYCNDGSLEVRGNNISLSIGLSNEADNKDKVNSMFNTVGLPKPSWNDYTDVEGYRNAQIYFGVEESRELLSYMGEPLPGFKYKWGY